MVDNTMILWLLVMVTYITYIKILILNNTMILWFLDIVTYIKSYNKNPVNPAFRARAKYSKLTAAAGSAVGATRTEREACDEVSDGGGLGNSYILRM